MYNKRRIFKRAHYIARSIAFMCKTYAEALSKGLKQSYQELRDYIAKEKEEAERKAEIEIINLRHKWNVDPTEDYWINLSYKRGTNVNTLGVTL